ncbi:hypothetical protein IKE71_03335 [Candidatus Saccharibacteria bacterium]|nr:hypothetical protein [Candidatus Saccharibacteria bacterium]
MQPIKEINLINRALRASLAMLGLFVLAFCLIPNLISEASATDITSNINWSPVSLALDPDTEDTETPIGGVGHGNILFNFIAATSVSGNNIGTMQVVKKRVSVTTSGKQFMVYLSTGSETDSGLALNGGDMSIVPINGTWSEPVAFTGKSWGYAVPGNASFGAGLATAPSISDYAAYDSIQGRDLTYASSEHYNKGKWAAVPVLGGAQQIWKATTTNTAGFGAYELNGSTVNGDTNNFFDIYYAAVVDTDLVGGEYKNTLVYTALASANDIDRVSNNLVRDQEFGTGGDKVTLAFDLASSTALVEYDDVNVWLVPHIATEGDGTAGSGNNYTTTGLDIYKTNDYKCTIAGSSDFTVYSNRVELACTVPTNPGAATNADGQNNTSGGATMAGEYDFWVEIPDYGYNYISKYQTSSGLEIGSFTYAGLQTRARDAYKHTSSAHRISTMQEVTPSICKNTNMWGTGTVDSARVYNYTGTGNPLASSASASAAIGVGTFLLGDNRETVTSGGQAGTNYKTYLVRRLADGNCWMVQNLDLNLADFTSWKSKRLTSENTNLNTKDIWIPDAALSSRTWSTNPSKIGGYDNVLGTTGILEPGPGYSSVGALSIDTYQFQSRNTFGPNLYWGSRYQANTATDNTGTANNNGLVIANNANSSFARSYNNDLAYLTGTQNVKNPTACAANTTEGNARIDECLQNGKIDNAYGSLTSITSSDGTTQDTTWQPSTITSNTDTTFTMRGSNYLGDYYNWYAATAETGQYSTSSGNMQDDICPKGWRLPRNSGTGSWDDLIKTTYQLTTSYGYTANNRKQLNKIMQLPLSIPFAGYYGWSNGSLNARGGDGDYWSSTPDSPELAHDLNVGYVGLLGAQDGHNKAYGFTVRCVARD